jgi:hypothetical protein
LAWTQLKRRRAGSVLAVLLVSVGALAAGLALTLADAHRQWVGELGSEFHAIVGPKSDGLGLVLEAHELLLPTEDVIPFALSPELQRRFAFDALVDLHVFAAHEGFPVVGVSDAYVRPAPGLPAPRLTGRWVAHEDEVVVGRRVAERLGLQPGDRFTVRHSPSRGRVEEARRRGSPIGTDFDPAPEPFAPVERPLFERAVVVVGVADHGGSAFDGAILTHRALGQACYGVAQERGILRGVSSAGATTYLMARLADSSRLGALQDLLHWNSTAQVVLVDEQLASLMGLLDDAESLLALGVALVVGLLAIAVGVLINTRYDALVHQLGVLRSLGYRRRRIALWPVLEALLVVALAFPVAALGELVVVSGLDLSGLLLVPAEPTWLTAWHVWLWVGMLAACVLAVGVPVWRLSRVAPADLVRGL